MKSPSILLPLVLHHLLLLLLLFSANLSSASSFSANGFIKCLNLPASVVFTPNNSSYGPVLDNGLQNRRFASGEYQRPSVIVTPTTETQIKPVILCAKKLGISIRVRCGGHDFEGLSYTTRVASSPPFVMVDMVKMQYVKVDVKTQTAWLGGGANLGETYYYVNQASPTLSFPGGVWVTVGAGGYISGGGYGGLKRKYGLGADNVIDARFMDVNGNILDRKSMGEDLFWAIRGGIASNFGVLLAWRVHLVKVPKVATVFNVARTPAQNASHILHKWQSFAPTTDRNLYLRIQITSANSTQGKRETRVTFEALFLGKAKKLLSIMKSGFPELGLTKADCYELSFIQATLYFGGDATFGLQGNVSALLRRDSVGSIALKAKSDYVQTPIPVHAIEEIFRRYEQIDVGIPTILFTPYGGKMDEYAPDDIPFPHRAGNLYMAYEGVLWQPNTSRKTVDSYLSWLNSLYDFMTPYVSKNPRGSYINYNDLDLGIGSSSYEEASSWGKKYWGDNFDRLIAIKSKVDPHNFFRHEQGIPTRKSLGLD